MKNIYHVIAILTVIISFPNQSIAQFTLDGQMLVRSEYRNGYQKLMNENADPAGFIAHRARIQASYKVDRLTFFMSIQDVRTWGSSSTANISDNYLSVHEAWAEVNFGEYWKLKLGRQELNYDNARFLGNLDWALQGRSHEFALMKYEKENAKLHMGFGFNQDNQKIQDHVYSSYNNYKAAQLVRFENKTGKFNYAFLFWNDGRQYQEIDNINNITNTGIRYLQTLALPTLKYTLPKTQVSGYFYYQFGKDFFNRSTSAYDISAHITHKLIENKEKGSKYTATAGFELISGTPTNDKQKNKSFAPLYGTNHAFNGFMDLFYVGNHFNSVGLRDIYLRTRYNFDSGFWIQGDYHNFAANATLLRDEYGGPEMDKGFGSEIDLSIGKVISESVSIQAGYSQFLASDTFNHIQYNGDLKENQNWAYIMFVFRPNNKAKFIGVPL
ncbi:alginate export family protein [Cyclobacterium sp. 1_MG-2023]|uniref:alginate export family protein n=1 Tax=Cyclobacterium sp. 1_MG-2023 TaxID=3062681 RepID=UPI0026E257A6|nr:alginate export family protein [Cyclobacterium sp. 1_MG-2023]MDO6435933.1 alginate export family protein [Cyclobacterium sp. 1_MG-2023]